jgi:hypothetical protein
VVQQHDTLFAPLWLQLKLPWLLQLKPPWLLHFVCPSLASAQTALVTIDGQMGGTILAYYVGMTAKVCFVSNVLRISGTGTLFVSAIQQPFSSIFVSQ